MAADSSVPVINALEGRAKEPGSELRVINAPRALEPGSELRVINAPPDGRAQAPDGRAPAPGGERSYSVINGLKVLTACFAALQLTAAFTGGNPSISYYCACALQVSAFTMILISKYVPGRCNTNLVMVLEQVGVFLATTSFFFAFSIFLPPIIWIWILYWAAYLIMFIIIICCFLNGNYSHHLSSSQASTTGINIA